MKDGASESLPGLKPDMVPVDMAFGSFEPVAAFTNGKDTVVADALMGLEEVKSLPAKVKCCQDAKFSGELDFVIDDFTAYKTLSRLLLVEEYCDRSRTLGFRVRLFALEPREKRKLVPLRQVRSLIVPEPPRKGRLTGIMEAVQRAASKRDRAARSD